MASVVCCGLLAAEMGACALWYAPSLIMTQGPLRLLHEGSDEEREAAAKLSPEQAKKKLQLERKQNLANFSSHAASSIFFGLAAANIVPGGALIAVALYAIYTFACYSETHAYYSASLLGHAVELPAKLLFLAGTAIVSYLLLAYSAIEKEFKQLRENAPHHAMWYAVVAQVVAAIAIAKLTGRL